MSRLDDLRARLGRVGALRLGAAVAILLAAVFLLLAAGGDEDSIARAAVDDALVVDAMEVARSGSYVARKSYAGRVAARRESALGFERGGLLAEVLVEEGERTEQGAVLARLDQRQLEADLQAAKARHRAAEAAVKEVAARLKLAEATEDRQRQLLEKGHISSQRYDEARYNRDAIDAQRASAHAEVARAEADVSRISAALDLSEIRAPFAGQITARLRDEGAVLAPGEAVLEISETGPVEVRVGLPESEAAGLKLGKNYLVEIGSETALARLDRVVDSVDWTTRTVLAVFAMIDESVTPPPGALARLALESGFDVPGFWLPIDALAESTRGLWVAYALTPAGDGLFKINPRAVELVHVETDEAFVRGTLRDGEMVVATGLHRLVPGQTVRIRNEKL